MCEISGPEICADEDSGLLECYTVLTGNWLPTLWVVLCLLLYGHKVNEEISAVLHLMAL
jgi:hypothetical protein